MRKMALIVTLLVLVALPAQAGWQDEIKRLYTKCNSLSSEIRSTMCGLSVASLDLTLVQGKYEEAKVRYEKLKSEFSELF